MVAVTIFDSLEFARTKQELLGKVEVVRLSRLADSLFAHTGSLGYRLTGDLDALQRPVVKVSVEGELHLECQRCLGKLPFLISSESSLLVLVHAGSAEGDAIEDLDGIPASAETDALVLVEDEVLLAVPFAPRHPEGQCNAAAGTANELRVSPFATLARLRQDTVQN